MNNKLLLSLVAWVVSVGGVVAVRSANAQQAREVIARNAGFAVTLMADGHYRVIAAGNGWMLEGALPADYSVLPPGSGADGIGRYHSLRAKSTQGASAAIYVYDNKPVVLFTESLSHGMHEGQYVFPTFTRLPADATRYSFKHQAFGRYEFNALNEEGPWVLFKGMNAMVLSPADNFLISKMSESSDGKVAVGIDPQTASVPDRYQHRTLLAAGNGVDDALQDWGAALQALSGKHAVSAAAGPVLNKLGYWTDNGAHYYYKYEAQLGYAGTLLAVKDSFAKLGIPLGYMQLDSWFYPKGDPPAWDHRGDDLAHGEYVYRADKKLFPDGLAAFQQKLGLPLVTHARWIATDSPYRKEFGVSGSVITNPAYWRSTAEYLKKSGVITYEQDWLDENATTAKNFIDPGLFLHNIAEGMLQQGIAMQYCMGLPADYLASTQFQNLTTMRTSGDRFERDEWDTFLYDSRLATVLGVRPWTDVFMSSELGNLLMSTLSSGPVGTGDALNAIHAENLKHAVRADGVIVKPEVGLHPLDRVYAEDAAGRQAPMIAVANSGDAGRTPDAYYVFAYPRKAEDRQAAFSLSELGMSGNAVVYDWVRKTARLVVSDAPVQVDFDGESSDSVPDEQGPSDPDRWALLVVVPVRPGQISLLGDPVQFAMLGSKRVKIISRTEKGLSAEVFFAPGERTVTLVGYAARRPQVQGKEGTAAERSFHDGLFTLQVTPSKNGRAVFYLE